MVLRTIDVVDSEGLYLKLGAIAGAIDKLETIPRFRKADTAEPKTPEQLPQTNTATGETIEQSTDDDAGFFAKAKQKLFATTQHIGEKYIRIRDRDAHSVPAETQRSQHFMQLNVRLLLEQAQLALLKQDQALYGHSLEQAEKLVAHYYSPSTPEYQFITEITALAKMQIAPKLPDISNSLKLLHLFIEEQHRLDPKTPNKQMQVSEVKP